MCDITEIVTIFIVVKKIKSKICELLMITLLHTEWPNLAILCAIGPTEAFLKTQF